MSDPYVVGIFTLAGAIVGVCGALAVAARAARAEERKHFRELGLKVALTNFEACMKMAQSATDRFNQPLHVPPLKTFIIQGIRLMEIVSDTSLSADEMAQRVAKMEDFTQEITRAAEQRQKQ
jgi:hypothetical protein